MEEKEIRLNKYLSDAGVCSRREGDRLIERGKVTIDGMVAKVGQKVQPGQKVCVNGKTVHVEEERVLFLFNKPRGIVCTSEKREKKNIMDYLHYPVRVTYVGRLDKESEGLMLMTNDGELNNKMMRARNKHEKEYQVRVTKPITPEFIEQMAGGVPILDTVTRPCKVKQIGKYRFDIILTQGLNRQIRRMCEYLGYEIAELKRVRIMNLELGSLPVGKIRELTREETEELYKMVDGSKE